MANSRQQELDRGQVETTAKILLDTPASSPKLGFDEISGALAHVIAESHPRFAVGIFGGWGSGKTTLMRAISNQLTQANVVKVDFNAWRFEREPSLLVPLLDTIRAGLVEWSEQTRTHDGERVRTIAGRVGRVARALATGLKGEVGLPGAAKVSYDVGKALDALTSPADPEQPQALYVAAFGELSDALRDLSSSGVDRVVVFVDDLDRCLPDSALDVLESIKLFFDLPGFVFVVGLDEEAVDRAVQAKFGAWDRQPGRSSADSAPGDVPIARPSGGLGREYVKKVFQVPYSLPAVVFEDIDQLLRGMYAESELSSRQVHDLESRVRPYLRYITVERRVNPREVKRFLNAYTLQTLVRPYLDRNTVLALQTLAFRYEWDEALSDVILADPPFFLETLRSFREGDDGAFADLAPHLSVLPPDLGEYLRSVQAEALVHHADLAPYVSSLRSTASLPSWLVEAYDELGALRRVARAVRDDPAAASAARLAPGARQALDRLRHSSFGPGESGRLPTLLSQLDELTERLRRTPEDPNALRDAAGQILRVVTEIYRELRRLRDVSPLAPT